MAILRVVTFLSLEFGLMLICLIVSRVYQGPEGSPRGSEGNRHERGEGE